MTLEDLQAGFRRDAKAGFFTGLSADWTSPSNRNACASDVLPKPEKHEKPQGALVLTICNLD